MPELAGYNTIIKISGDPLSMTDEITATTDFISYQITNPAKQVLDPGTPPTVQDNGVATAEAYSVNYLSGTIAFEAADPDRVVTVSGNYLPMTVAAYAHSASNSRIVDMQDKTVFGDTHRKRKPGLKSASGTLNHFDVADPVYGDALAAGDPLIIEQRASADAEPDRFYALLESEEVTAAIESLQDAAVSWISCDKWLRLGK